jgi:hypothetical protein
MLWMTQYQVLVMMSAKGRSPVFPDMFSSVFLSQKDCFLEGSIDTGRLGIRQRTSSNQQKIQNRLSLLYQGYIGNILDKYSYPPFDAASHTKKIPVGKQRVVMDFNTPFYTIEIKLIKKNSNKKSFHF